jgi:FkbM family methyltransferase
MTALFDKSMPFSIYGFGNVGRKLAKQLSMAGYVPEYFVDEQAGPEEIRDGIKCIRPGFVKSVKIDQVLIAVFNRDSSPRAIVKSLRHSGVRAIVGYTQLEDYFAGISFSSFWYQNGMKTKLVNFDESQIKKIFLEKKSQEIFHSIINFRKSGMIDDHPEGDGLENQYFSPDISGWATSEIDVLVDCGSYTGDTIELAKNKKISINKAYCFEPDVVNFELLKKNLSLSQRPRCILVPRATWSTSDLISFCGFQGESSRVDNSLDSKIQAIAIDDYFDKIAFDFLKIDVEGSDLQTLKGALKSIKKYRPRIAVGIYHCPEDLEVIPTYLYNNLEKYEFYLRQHGHNGIDTVLYAMPRTN